MKVYCPLNLNYPNETDSKIYGWIDETTKDIFISSFTNPIWFPEFNVHVKQKALAHKLHLLLLLGH